LANEGATLRLNAAEPSVLPFIAVGRVARLRTIDWPDEVYSWDAVPWKPHRTHVIMTELPQNERSQKLCEVPGGT
jgi:hypothetical protein